MQFIRLNFEEDDSTDLFNRQHLIGMRAGVYSGFDLDGTTAGTTLVLSHSATGYKEVKEDLTETPFLGSVKTRQGVHIYEDGNVSIGVTNNSANANPRIDLVVIEHEYTAIAGGTSAGYVVILGTPGASPVAPALTFPNKQTIIGQIYWPANVAHLTSTGVVYTKAATPPFAGDAMTVRTIGTQSIIGRKEFQLMTGIMNTVTLNTGTNVLSAAVSSNYYELAYIGVNYEDINNFSFPYTGGAIPITVITNQRLRINAGAQIRFQNGRTQMSLEIGESFTVLDITNSVTTGATNVYLVLNGGDVHRDGVSKMFGQLVGNKGVATINTTNGTVSFDETGNFYELSYNFDSSSILALKGTDAYANPIDNITKAGNLITLRLFDSGSSTDGALLINGGATSGVPGMKPVSIPSGSDVYLKDGALLLLQEDETEYILIEAIDYKLNMPALYTAMNAVVQNKETQWTKIQSDGWKDLGATALNGSGHLILTDEGNHFQCIVDPFDTTAIAMTDIKIQRGAAPAVAAPTGCVVSVRFVHSQPVIGVETFKIDLGAGSNIRSEVSDENLGGLTANVAYHLIAGLYGIEGQVITFRKSNTKWDIIGISDQARLGTRIKLLETSVGTLNAAPTWVPFTGVTYASGFAAGTPSPRFFKTTSGRVQLNGNIASTSTATSPAMFTLPVGYRPSRVHNYAIEGGNGTTNFLAVLNVDTAGVVTLIGNALNGVSYSLDQVSFYLN